MKHVLSALMENQPGVLRRIAGLFGRRGYNIDSIVASVTEDERLTRMTIVVDCDEKMIEQVRKQVAKLDEIVEVVNVTNIPTIKKQLLMMKIEANIDNRIETITLAKEFGARVIDISAEYLVIEATDEDAVISSIIETFSPYGIIELVKTGTVAMIK